MGGMDMVDQDAGEEGGEPLDPLPERVKENESFMHALRDSRSRYFPQSIIVSSILINL